MNLAKIRSSRLIISPKGDLFAVERSKCLRRNSPCYNH
ncbi:unnamed protein product [Acidithrix sp. C25]|nr:unnamed protein product [Acidithrix sp. C25]